MLTCDWCGESMDHDVWVVNLELEVFHALSPGRRYGDAPSGAAPGIQVHRDGCADDLLNVISALLEKRRGVEKEDRPLTFVDLPKGERARRVLEVIGENAYSQTEVVRALADADGTRIGNWAINQRVYPALRELLGLGEIVREHGMRGSYRRWIYSRPRHLSGEIAELDKQFRGEG